MANSTLNSSAVQITLGTAVAKNATLNITIAGILNPNSTKTPSSFVVEATTGGYKVEAQSTGLLVGAAKTASFKQAVTITPTSKLNGKWCMYELSFAPSVSYLNGSKLQLRVPSEVSLPVNVSCSTGVGFTTSNAASCRVLDQTTI